MERSKDIQGKLMLNPMDKFFINVGKGSLRLDTIQALEQDLLGPASAEGLVSFGRQNTKYSNCKHNQEKIKLYIKKHGRTCYLVRDNLRSCRDLRIHSIGGSRKMRKHWHIRLICPKIQPTWII